MVYESHRLFARGRGGASGMLSTAVARPGSPAPGRARGRGMTARMGMSRITAALAADLTAGQALASMSVVPARGFPCSDVEPDRERGAWSPWWPVALPGSDILEALALRATTRPDRGRARGRARPRTARGVGEATRHPRPRDVHRLRASQRDPGASRARPCWSCLTQRRPCRSDMRRP